MPLVPPSLGRHPGRPEEHTRLRAHVISHVISRDPHARRSTRVSEHMWGTHDGGRMTLRYYSYTTAIPSRGSGGNGDGPTPVSVDIGGSETDRNLRSCNRVVHRLWSHGREHTGHCTGQRWTLEAWSAYREVKEQLPCTFSTGTAAAGTLRNCTVTLSKTAVGSRACVHLRSHKDAPTHEHD